MEKKISEKYNKLYEACHRYPEIILLSEEERRGCSQKNKSAELYIPPKARAKNGFIEKFCL